MKRKIIYDILFIILSASILSLVIDRSWAYEYRGLAFLPVLAAYYAGQYVERKLKAKRSSEL